MFLQGPTIPTVSTLPSAASNSGRLLVQGGKLWWSDGSSWTDLGAAGGGSDPWTYVVLGSDFTTSSATAVNVTGLEFTPAANTRYEAYGQLWLRTVTNTVGARPGLAWPTGLTDGVVSFWTASSATAQVIANGNINAAVLCANTGHPNTTQSWPATFEASFLSGASPSGNFRLQLATETAATNVTMRAGSWLKYRTF